MSEKVYVNICDKRKCPGPVYAVKKGGILKNVSMSFEELAKVNRILYNLIVPAGTILLIPGK